jgi:hypothetical protein
MMLRGWRDGGTLGLTVLAGKMALPCRERNRKIGGKGG